MAKKPTTSKSKSAEPELPEVLQPEPIAETPAPEMVTETTPTKVKLLAGAATAFLLLAMLFGGFNLLYAGKIFPGATAGSSYLGGLSQPDALAAINAAAVDYAGKLIPVTYGQTTLRISPGRLGLDYHAAQTANEAFSFGRRGSLGQRLREQVASMLGHGPSLARVDYDIAKLHPYLSQVLEDVTSPVANATLGFHGVTSYVVPAQSGARLDQGVLVQRIGAALAAGASDAIAAPVYGLEPVIDTASVQIVSKQADTYLSSPLNLQVGERQVVVSQSDIVKWIDVKRDTPRSFEATNNVADIVPHTASVTVTINQAAVRAYTTQLAKSTDQDAQDAILTMTDGKLAIASPSHNGYKIDQDQAYDAISQAIVQNSTDRTATINVAITKAKVTEDTIGSLGIQELISEGQTFFPGSPSTRLINVRAGARQFNNVLLAPDEVFSFGKILGAVGPETGYVPELVILGDHEEKQYGGGLCQVSSTAFRAALYAGLPILERVNHAFAISYYTAPFGAPGVDATIYYPQVDFKFKNDTGHYLLMQTAMQGTTLKFSFYGTKTKSGTIRGPQFVTGTTDATLPSHTVFFRDVMDMAGTVVKTDTFNTFYKSSKDFPITKQFN